MKRQIAKWHAEVEAEGQANLKAAAELQAWQDEADRLSGRPTAAQLEAREREKWEFIKSEWAKSGVGFK
jgi:hypothetical protein